MKCLVLHCKKFKKMTFGGSYPERGLVVNHLGLRHLKGFSFGHCLDSFLLSLPYAFLDRKRKPELASGAGICRVVQDMRQYPVCKTGPVSEAPVGE